jgi:hypothetical protein
MDARFTIVDQRFTMLEQRMTASDQKSDLQFEAIMAAISESKAHAELNNLRAFAALSERVAVLEAQRH